MFSRLDLPAAELVIRAVVIYLAVLVLLRISGKRQIGQMGPTEFVAVLLISNAVQNSMNGGDNSLLGGLILATALVSLSALISYLTYRGKIFSAIFEGTPTLVVHKSAIVKSSLRREWVSENELHSLLRKQGVHKLTEIESAILEPDGTLTVVRAVEPGAGARR